MLFSAVLTVLLLLTALGMTLGLMTLGALAFFLARFGITTTQVAASSAQPPKNAALFPDSLHKKAAYF